MDAFRILVGVLVAGAFGALASFQVPDGTPFWVAAIVVTGVGALAQAAYYKVTAD